MENGCKNVLNHVQTCSKIQYGKQILQNFKFQYLVQAWKILGSFLVIPVRSVQEQFFRLLQGHSIQLCF